MQAVPPSKRKRRLRITEWVFLILVILGLVGVDLMFYFWPFRYRQVHPLLESAFRSRVDVKHYHRTYFPHPGFVAEDVTFYRGGDTSIPPLATMNRMTVVGTWTGLIFHPHTLYEMRLDGLHVQIPLSGPAARGFDGSVLSPSQSKMNFQTIIADGTTLDFLRSGVPPLRFGFSILQIHNVHAGDPLTFSTRVSIPGPQGTVEANGSLGPFASGHYAATPLSGTYSLQNADLSRVSGLVGHVAAEGRFSGNVSAVEVQGKAAIPDFRAGDSHRVRLDASYRVKVSAASGNVEIQNAAVKTGDSIITANGSVSGSPKTVYLSLATNNSRVEQLLDIVEKETPSVAGYVDFQATARFQDGTEPFLRRLNLQGQLSLHRVKFVQEHTQREMDAFSARVRRPTPAEPDPDHGGDDVEVTAEASSHTTIHDGMATFPDARVSLPGAQAQLHGTFNLLTTKIRFTGNADLQRNISHAVTGWKSILLKPLAPFFRHKDTGAAVPIAVTGTARDPNVTQDVLHDK